MAEEQLAANAFEAPLDGIGFAVAANGSAVVVVAVGAEADSTVAGGAVTDGARKLVVDDLEVLAATGAVDERVVAPELESLRQYQLVHEPLEP